MKLIKQSQKLNIMRNWTVTLDLTDFLLALKERTEHQTRAEIRIFFVAPLKTKNHEL